MKYCPDDYDYTINSKCILSSPIYDHSYEIRKNCKTLAIVAQPYKISNVEHKEAVAFCDKNGFEMEISAEPSWHFPGKSISVVFTRA